MILFTSMNSAEAAGVAMGAIASFLTLLTLLSSFQWFKINIGWLYRSVMWTYRGDAWFCTRIERSIGIMDYEILLHDVVKRQRIPADGIQNIVEKCWQYWGTDAATPDPLWQLLLKAGTLQSSLTLDAMCLKFLAQMQCTDNARRYFLCFLENLSNDGLNLHEYPAAVLGNLDKVIQTGAIKFPYNMVFKTLNTLGPGSPEAAWSTFASIANNIEFSTLNENDIRMKLEPLRVLVCDREKDWSQTSKCSALTSLGFMSRLLSNRISLPATMKVELETYPPIKLFSGVEYSLLMLFDFEDCN